MSDKITEHYQKACEFTFPIKLNIPVTVHPQVSVIPANSVQEKLAISFEPDILLEPEVKSKKPVCRTLNGYEKESYYVS